MRLSLLDFCTVYEGESVAQSMARSVELAQNAEKLGFYRMWYTEHHNMPSITSSAPAVLIAHIGAHTSTIRLGAGGVMLPNHSPYVIAEQFGTLTHLYPGRIDLGLGRAPGTDMNTLGRALRRAAQAAERFPEDVRELQGFLGDNSLVPGVRAYPGYGTNVPLYILGSSMFGASLAAQYGLPFAFASHFAPAHLRAALEYYRTNFQPSAQLSAPYTIAGVNVIAADDPAQAALKREQVIARRVQALRAPAPHIESMLEYTAQGASDEVANYLSAFQESCGADELMISVQDTSHHGILHALEIIASGCQLG